LAELPRAQQRAGLAGRPLRELDDPLPRRMRVQCVAVVELAVANLEERIAGLPSWGDVQHLLNSVCAWR
jgi:hypothetical protein